MFKNIQNMFKVKDMRKRLLYTFLMLVILRLGSQIPIPGINRDYFRNWFSQQTEGAFNFFSAFTGGSFENMSLFALNITPYITASIIIELLTIAVPALDEMRKDGEDGRKKMTKITRYTAIGLSVFQGAAMTIGFGKSGLLVHYSFLNAVIVIAALTAGSAFVIWMADSITKHGIGNGTSIVLLINILSRIPQDMVALWRQFVYGKTIAKGVLSAAVITAVLIGIAAVNVVLNDMERRIPVRYAGKRKGSPGPFGIDSNIPLKVNTAGVIPVIFASSLFSIPSILMAALRKTPGGIWGTVIGMLNQNNWFDFSHPVYMIGYASYIALCVFFAYFYTSITFNPMEVADDLKKQGAFIPGIRPGTPTRQYLEKILSYLVFIGAVSLISVVTIPIFFSGVFNANVSFGGTSLIIVVGVILETSQQIKSNLWERNYKSFLP